MCRGFILKSLNGNLANLCRTDNEAHVGGPSGPGNNGAQSARVSMAQSLGKVRKPHTLQTKDGGHLPLLKEPVSVKYSSKKHDRYPQPAPETKKVT